MLFDDLPVETVIFHSYAKLSEIRGYDSRFSQRLQGTIETPGTDASEGRWARCQDSCFTEQLPGYRSCHQDYPNSWTVFESPFDSWLYDIRKGWFHEWEYPNSWMVRMVFLMENPSINGWLGVPLFQKPPYGVLLSIRLRRIRIDDNPWLDPWKSYETTRTKGDIFAVFEHCSIHGLIHLNHEGFGVSHQGLRPEKKTSWCSMEEVVFLWVQPAQ